MSSKLNALGLPTAKLQENPLVNDVSVLSKNFPPPATAGATLIGPNAKDTTRAEIVIGYSGGAGGIARPAGDTYYYIPATILNDAGAEVRGFLMFSTAHP